MLLLIKDIAAHYIHRYHVINIFISVIILMKMIIMLLLIVMLTTMIVIIIVIIMNSTTITKITLKVAICVANMNIKFAY